MKHEERARTIFRTAGCYSKSARILNQNIDNSVLLPSMVNAALALELYFKSLHLIEYKTDFKESGRHSHDFYKIYEKLRPDLRVYLKNYFQSILSSRPMTDVKILKKEFGSSVPLTFRENVKEWSDVFTSLRYFFDKPKKAKTMMFFPEIEVTLVDYFKKIRPEFLK